MLKRMRPRVLIVEDNARVRAVIRHLIDDVASQIYECGDGHAAETIYAAERPDWVLMDISMPGLDGMEATRRLTAKYPYARVVILTDHADKEYQRAALEAGACAYLLKEDMPELIELLGGRDVAHE